MGLSSIRRFIWFISGFGLGTLVIIALLLNVNLKKEKDEERIAHEISKFKHIDSQSPFIFISGFPHSGKAVIRKLLDTHPQVSCGPEARVISSLVTAYDSWYRSKYEAKRLKDAGLFGDPIDESVTAFLLEFLRLSVSWAPRLCSVDPFIKLEVMAGLFPNSKFVMMIRDGRAVAHSNLKSKLLTTPDINKSEYIASTLKDWNRNVTKMLFGCSRLGASRCFVLRFENLVLDSEFWLRKVAGFLNVSRLLDMDVVRHSQMLNNKLHTTLSDKGSDQSVPLLNTRVLSEWYDDQLLPRDFLRTSHLLASMLEYLGYYHFPPKYDSVNKLSKSGSFADSAIY